MPGEKRGAKTGILFGEILDYILVHFEGRRGVNVYQRIRKEFPLSLSAPTICLLQSLQGRCSMVVIIIKGRRSVHIVICLVVLISSSEVSK